jgi:hypothetical protein
MGHNVSASGQVTVPARSSVRPHHHPQPTRRADVVFGKRTVVIVVVLLLWADLPRADRAMAGARGGAE